MFHSIMAHAGEKHEETAEAVSHALPWYFAVPLFILAVAAVGYTVWLLSGKKPGVVMIVLAFVLLISGFTLFNVSAAISVIAITAGLLLAGFMAFTGLANDTKPRK